MNRQWTSVMGGLLVALGFAGGCASAASGAHSGVDPAKQGDELSRDELGRLCVWAVHNKDSKISSAEIGCRTSGIAIGIVQAALGSSDAIIQEACGDAYDSCMKDAAAPESAENRCEALGTDAAAECDATVGDIETCLTQTIDELEEQFPTCSELTQDSEAAPDEPAAADTPECQRVTDKCPGALLLVTL